MKRILKKVLIILVIISVLLVPISIAKLRDVNKNYIYISNSNAKNILNCINSDDYIFFDYCKENNIPENGIVYLSGECTSYCDLIIDANEYCDQRKNLTKNTSQKTSVAFYWTIKIENNMITEIWTCKIPLSQDKLKTYDLDEQRKMMPLFKKDKFNYAIGYYKNEDQTTR
ncbi:MAG: hypothetical protein IKV85_06115 [Ruminococcus sp.]|nr:hypothetical protein [Ruminococcus sp.]